MERLVRFFIENNRLTVLLMVFSIITGIIGLLSLNRQTFPSVDFATVIITTPYGGASAEDIELKITKPIEDKLKAVSGLKDVTSTSMPGLSLIKIRMDLDAPNRSAISDEIQKAVDKVSDLPVDLASSPQVKELNSDEISVVEIGVVGPNENGQLNLLTENLKEQLEDIKGTSSVTSVGFQNRQFRIFLDMDKLSLHHIGVDEVLGRIRGRNINIPGGLLSSSSGHKLVRLDAKVTDHHDLANIFIRANFSGKKIFLKDVARVEDAREQASVLVSINGKTGHLLKVTKSAGADSIDQANKVMEILKKTQSDWPDHQLITYYNEAEKIGNKLENLSSNAVSGFILVVVFLMLFLPGRLGFMASLSLPITVLLTFSLMPYFGVTFDTISVLALVIALGMLVDNSVVVTENYTRLLSHGLDKKDAAVEAVAQLWLPITATVLTTIAAFLPMMVTKGVMGEFIRFIPIVVSISLLVSLIESFFLLPLRLQIAARVNKGGHGDRSDWFRSVQTWFEKFMEYCLKYRYIVALVFGAMIFGSVALTIWGNKFILFPPGNTERYIARYELTSGTPVETTYLESNKLVERIKAVLGDDLESIINKAGDGQFNAMDAKGTRGEHAGLVMINLTADAAENSTHEGILGKLRSIDKGGFRDLRFEAEVNGPPVGSAIKLTFRSANSDQLEAMTSLLKKQAETVPGILNLKFAEQEGGAELLANFDYDKIARLGLDVGLIGNTVRTALEGSEVSNVVLNNKVVKIKVELKKDQKQDISNVLSLKVMDPKGNLIPLKKLMAFEANTGSRNIKHFDFQRSRTLVGDVNTEVLTSQKANEYLKGLFEAHSGDFPLVSYTIGGEEESTKESMESLAIAMGLALLGIFSLLVFLFKSYLRPIIIMLCIPFGFIGYAVAFYFHQLPVSFLSLIGMVGLSGIVVNSGIVLISFIDQMRHEGLMSLTELLKKASGIRLKAVLVTSLTTFSGLIPTAYGLGGADPMLVPMTMAMAWGLASGTFFTLVWVPCGYAILEDLFYALKIVRGWLWPGRAELFDKGSGKPVLDDQRKVASQLPG